MVQRLPDRAATHLPFQVLVNCFSGLILISVLPGFRQFQVRNLLAIVGIRGFMLSSPRHQLDSTEPGDAVSHGVKKVDG